MTRTTPAPDPVRSPTVLQCCTAAAGLVRGLVRPRRPDRRFLRSIADARLVVRLPRERAWLYRDTP